MNAADWQDFYESFQEYIPSTSEEDLTKPAPQMPLGPT